MCLSIYHATKQRFSFSGGQPSALSGIASLLNEHRNLWFIGSDFHLTGNGLHTLTYSHCFKIKQEHVIYIYLSILITYRKQTFDNLLYWSIIIFNIRYQFQPTGFCWLSSSVATAARMNWKCGSIWGVNRELQLSGLLAHFLLLNSANRCCWKSQLRCKTSNFTLAASKAGRTAHLFYLPRTA